MDLRLSGGVEEVIVLHRDDNNHRTTRTIFRKNKRRKKSTGGLGTLDKVVRRVVISQKAAAETYLKRHDESNQNKSDGWLRDLGYNVYKATRRGLKKVSKLPGLPGIDLDS
jgi:hypothetical protein